MTQDKGASSNEDRVRATLSQRDFTPNGMVEYENQLYVEGVRDLAKMIDRDRTANWPRTAYVLRDCADLIEQYSRQSKRKVD